jgi:hypothetical protein
VILCVCVCKGRGDTGTGHWDWWRDPWPTLLLWAPMPGQGSRPGRPGPVFMASASGLEKTLAGLEFPLLHLGRGEGKQTQASENLRCLQ